MRSGRDSPRRGGKIWEDSGMELWRGKEEGERRGGEGVTGHDQHNNTHV